MKSFTLSTRSLSVIRSVRISAVSMTSEETRAELDSHADTCVVGKAALVIHDHNRPVQVTGYNESHGAKTYKTVDAVIGYDDPTTGEVRMILVNQAIHMPELNHHLLCPMQIRMNDVMVNDVPKFMTKDATEKTHAIVFGAGSGTGDELIIPLSLQGVTSYFPCRKVTAQEYENAEERYELTYRDPEWDPSDPTYERQETSMVDHRGQVIPKVPVKVFHIACAAVEGTSEGIPYCMRCCGRLLSRYIPE